MTRSVEYRAGPFVLIDRLWRIVFPDDPPRSRAMFAIPAKLPLNDKLLLVAQAEPGALVGTIMAGWDGHRGWLDAVAVDPAVQRQGVGQLIAAALVRLAARGCGKVNLQIRAGNTAVVAFYERLGFAVEPRTSMGRTI